jgi:colanic acid biosynthesis protein WcaH
LCCVSPAAPVGGQWAWHDGAPPNLIKPHEFFRAYIDATSPL